MFASFIRIVVYRLLTDFYIVLPNLFSLFFFFQIVFYPCCGSVIATPFAPTIRPTIDNSISPLPLGLTIGPTIGANKYHSHYNEIRPSRRFFLYPRHRKETLIRPDQRIVSCHEEREDIRQRYRGCTVLTFDGPVVCPP